ncbi:unnamed protein product [Peniophora sp. CBMAI 1063]|nr:unnamed protein product [Peniophora sp. CBMAI 1063]
MEQYVDGNAEGAEAEDEGAVNENEDDVDETYGEHAPKLLTLNLLTAIQFRVLEPLVSQYIVLDGQERAEFVLKAFQDVWDGETIEWDTPVLWPSRTSNKRFHIVHKPGDRKSEWDPVQACGHVYVDTIHELITEVSGLRHGDQYWIREYKKARLVLYYSLSDEDRNDLDTLVFEWNKNGLPPEQKRRKFMRSGKKKMLDMAVDNLKNKGVYTFFMIIPEPGVATNAEFVDFSTEMVLGEKRFHPHHTSMTGTLARLLQFVNQSTGLGKVTNKRRKKIKDAMDRLTGYAIRPSDYRGRDGLLLRRADFSPELQKEETKNALYYIFSTAHANISSSYPKYLDVPWTDIAATDSEGNGLLVDGNQAARVELLEWLFTIGELIFHHWKRKNGPRLLPVAHADHYWATTEADSQTAELQRSRDKALNARPCTPTEPTLLPVPGTAAASTLPPAPLVPFLPSAPARMTIARSRYGSAREVQVHDPELRNVLDQAGAPIFTHILDPDDFAIALPLVDGLTQPLAVPHTAEARAQWCLHFLTLRATDLVLPETLFQQCVRSLAELPLVQNHGYGSTNFASGLASPFLPPDVDWHSAGPTLTDNPATVAAVEAYLCSSPWQFAYNDELLFSGFDMAWACLLAALLYSELAQSYEVGRGISYEELQNILQAFHQFLRTLAERHAYPGHGPAMKYALVDSRQEYLYGIFRMHEPLISLLEAVQKLPNTTPPTPCSSSSVTHFPSWQSPRCGLPVAMHKDPHLVGKMQGFLSEMSLVVESTSGTAGSREDALLHLLQVAFLLADLESIQMETWDEMGQLETSSLRGHEDELMHCRPHHTRSPASTP